MSRPVPANRNWTLSMYGIESGHGMRSKITWRTGGHAYKYFTNVITPLATLFSPLCISTLLSWHKSSLSVEVWLVFLLHTLFWSAVQMSCFSINKGMLRLRSLLSAKLNSSRFMGGNSTKATSGINGAGTLTQQQHGIPDNANIFFEDTKKSVCLLLFSFEFMLLT